ncbi:MAG: methyltransferase domain-containing protein [Dehalococcoidia bacterium]|nr:methyltransferase domain-containing protein [Dehalococcoidia bacterium]
MSPSTPARAPHPIQRTAVELFAPLAPGYERWGALLSLGQDARWRAEMVARLDLAPGSLVLDVAAGTGLIARLVEARGCRAVAIDQSGPMLREAYRRGTPSILATAEALPVADDQFDAVTFSYLLRYVADPLTCMRELVGVLRPGGRVGMVEFGRPRGLWGPPWWLYTRIGLPAAGMVAGDGWRRVGSFLGPSIDDLHDRFPGDALGALWRDAGLVDVHIQRRSLGGGVLMWGRKP